MTASATLVVGVAVAVLTCVARVAPGQPRTAPHDQDKCKDIACPPDDVICPNDSYKYPSSRHLDDCCSTSEGCACLPDPICGPPACDGTEVPKILKPGSSTPGSCCPVYVCVNESTCVYDEKVHSNFEKWEDKCYTYFCRNGVVERDKKPCNSSHLVCSGTAIHDDGCCPVCTGCMSSGNFYNNDERWKEDNGCKSCTCVNGQVECHAEMCHTTCKNPVHVPGQCCGYCPDPDYVTLPPDCPDLGNCQIHCNSGLQKDVNGCSICECRPDSCDLECRYGYVGDDFGDPLCKCLAREGLKCPSLNCKKKCPNGYKLDDYNCPVCKCNKCRKMSKCFKACPLGFQADSAGCKLCQCIEDKALALFNKCYSSDGRWYNSGESWNDGCRNCICKEGHEYCSLIFCPNPTCKHPVVIKGECCAKCLGDDSGVSFSSLSVCHAGHDHSYMHGEVWDMDHCTSCICHEGRFLCSTQECPPVPCESPLVQDGCCPRCPDHTLSLSEDIKLQCYANDGHTVYLHGQQWRASPCQSCLCNASRIECFSEECPKLFCTKPLLQKNKCCPICPDTLKLTSYCISNDTFFADGEHWMVDKCTTCDCHNGIIKCIQKHCSKMCYNPVYSSHPCCSDCIEKPPSDYRYEIIFIVLGVLIVSGLSVCLLALCLFYKKRRHTKSSNIMILHANELNPDDSKAVQCKLISRLPDITCSGNT